MKEKNSTTPLLLSAILLIVCAGWNYVWIFISLAIKIFSVVESAANSTLDFDYTNLSDWLSLVNLGTIMGIIHKLLTYAVVFFQIIGGIIGIIYVLLVKTEHKTKWNFIPVIFGVVTSIIGFFSTISLYLSSIDSFGFMYIFMTVTLLVMPIIFTVYAVRFKNELNATSL